MDTLTPKPPALTPQLPGNHAAQVSGAEDRAPWGRQYIILDTVQPHGAARDTNLRPGKGLSGHFSDRETKIWGERKSSEVTSE